MAIDVDGLYPKLAFFSDIARFHKDPNLWVVGRWVNAHTVTGDASGGNVIVRLKVMPQSKILPYLPNLEFWYNLDQLLMQSTDSANLKYGVRATSYNSIEIAGYTSNASAQIGVLVDGADGYYYSQERAYKDWILMASVNYGMSCYFQANTNTKTYTVYAGGLILKSKDQLVSEHLWDWVKPKTPDIYIRTGC